jgi:hypothetical protein
MSGAATQNMINQFDAQFTPDGEGYLYRRGKKGAAIRISADEYHGFIASYKRAVRHLIWGMYAVLSVTMVGMVAWSVMTDQDVKAGPLSITLYACLIAELIGFVWLVTLNYRRPARVLERRAPISGALSSDEFRRRHYAATSWGKLFGAIGTMILGSAVLVWQQDILHGWGRLWLVMIAVVAGVAIMGIWRKWRYTVSAR